MNSFNGFQYLGALNRCRLSLTDDASAVMMSLVNGGAAGKEAFAAFARFRDAGGSLILPPYEGFNHSARGAAYFLVSGGELTAPIATTHAFTAPLGAATLEIELRPWKSGERPRLSLEPRLVRKGQLSKQPAGLNIHRIAVSDSTSAVTLLLANGGLGEKKAFVASVGFLDSEDRLIQPPYVGFSRSNDFGAYFYVEGGNANAPAATTHSFIPPAEAVTMEVELRPWRFRSPAQFADEPRTVLRQAIKPPEPQAMRAESTSGAISAYLASAPIGSQISRRINADEIRIAGILGDGLRTAWADQITDATLSFDRYDRSWDRSKPSHLVIDANQLPCEFGWEHALTLRDPTATVEMAAMLQKARMAGIVTVLVEPQESHRYPLLPRIALSFDLIVKLNEATSRQPEVVLSPKRQ